MKKNKMLFVGLVAATVFGFNMLDVDAAGKNYVDTFPDSIVRSNYNVYANGKELDTADGSELAPINYMTDQTGIYVLYCSNRAISTSGGATDTLTKGDKLDYKIAYLLKNGYPNKSNISGVVGYNINTGNDTSVISGVTANDLADFWITQVGLWTLQGTVSSNHNILSNTGYYINSYSLCNGTSDALCGNNPVSGATLSKYVNTLVNAANAANDPGSATLAINFDNKWELSNDIYKSSVFELTSSTGDPLSSISFDLSNVPSGTKLYAENGTDLTENAKSITGATKFYLTIPKSAVTSGNSNFKITASSNITYDVAYQYVDKVYNHQPSVLVGPESKEITNVMSITIVPDTGSIISKSIYFVGFILLAFGAGIIYINIKQQNRNEEV